MLLRGPVTVLLHAILCHMYSIPSQLHLWTLYIVGFAPVYIVVDETSGVMIVY